MSAAREHRPSEGGAHPAPTEQAVFKPSRWPGVIWAIPVAALGIVVWLGLRDWLGRGPSVTVDFPVVAGLKAGNSEIRYQGYTVGHVGDIAFADSLTHMVVTLNFLSSMKGHLGAGTRYWISGTSSDVGNLSSLVASVSGPYVSIDPRPGPTVRRATGVVGSYGPGPGAVPYRIVFDGGPQGLKPGAEVDLEGEPAGAVTAVALLYDPAKGALQTRVDVALQPQRIQLAGQHWDGPDPAPQMNRMLEALIAHGLRAEIASSVPVIGGKIVRLAKVDDAPPGRLEPGAPPQIPNAGPSAGLDQQVQQTIAQLRQALQQVQVMFNAQKAENAAPGTADLPHALGEITRAARSLRELTDYLNSHPNALIFGRKN